MQFSLPVQISSAPTYLQEVAYKHKSVIVCLELYV